MTLVTKNVFIELQQSQFAGVTGLGCNSRSSGVDACFWPPPRIAVKPDFEVSKNSVDLDNFKFRGHRIRMRGPLIPGRHRGWRWWKAVRSDRARSALVIVTPDTSSHGIARRSGCFGHGRAVSA